MLHVKLMGPLRTKAGVDHVDVEAQSIKAMLAAIADRIPALAAEIEGGVAVAIDGQIFQDALLHQIADGSEVHLLPQIAGG